MKKVMSGKAKPKEQEGQEGQKPKEGGEGAEAHAEKGGFGLEDALHMVGGKNDHKGEWKASERPGSVRDQWILQVSLQTETLRRRASRKCVRLHGVTVLIFLFSRLLRWEELPGRFVGIASST